MARTKEFDREKVLQAAIRVFSKHGFAAASTDELMQEMGIGRQSMYDTFGDKRTLFLEALRKYSAESCGLIVAELRKPGSPTQVLQDTLISFSERKELASPEGCMGLNALSEFGLADADVNAALKDGGGGLQKELVAVLERAGERGDTGSARCSAGGRLCERYFCRYPVCGQGGSKSTGSSATGCLRVESVDCIVRAIFERLRPRTPSHESGHTEYAYRKESSIDKSWNAPRGIFQWQARTHWLFQGAKR